MPANIKFKKKQVAPNSNVYAIKLDETPYLTKTDANQTITFTRVGQDHDLGFTISFDGVDAPSDIVVNSGQNTATISAPDTAQELEWKYSVSFHNDASEDDIVVDLDPIIVINPGISSSSLFLNYTAAFIAGAAAVYLVARFIPGILGLG